MEQRKNHPSTAAVIAAAGGSTRMGVPKQLLPLRGVPVLARTLRAFQEAERVDYIVVVARQEDVDGFYHLGQVYGIDKLTAVVPGGDTRQESVARGAAALPADVRYIAVHDGARPLIRPAVIDRVIAAAYAGGGAAAGVKVKDTVKIADGEDMITGTPDRRFLWNVQTPQVFERTAYMDALEAAQAAGLDFTDDCQLMERAGHRVRLIEADYGNLKITTPEDVAFAEGLLGRERAGMRIGHGYDVHRLVEGRRLILGGVEIPWEKGLLGHSDADVLTHAVMDALLGGAALGDIGGLFPDTDPAYKGADSLELLRRTAETVKAAGCRIGNIDATVLAQAPKLKPYISAMRDNLAAACGVTAAQVSVKATTEEGLGFTGTGEGIAAHAVCLLEEQG